jgi:NADP-dependent 3-hydroxy acid dehydrogenase YdfG
MQTSSRPAAIITGASSGIGAAIAGAFARNGIDVALAARRQERLLALADELIASGGRALAVSADVTDEGAMRMLASRTLAAFGRIDILVCSAGLGFQGSIEDTSATVLQHLSSVNVAGTLNAVRAVLPYFESQRAGHIIVISSIAGRRGLPGYAAYCAVKFAQAGLAEALRAEIRESGIAVTTVFPVSADTEFRDAMTREFGVQIHGAGPIQKPDTIARAVVRAIRTRAPEVYPLKRARLLIWLNTFAPGIVDRIARRYARTRATDLDAEDGREASGDR